jgi:DNA-directed RNA polymerase subunit H
MSSDLVREVYKSRKNLLDILEVRGFDVQNYSNFGITDIDAMVKHDQLDMTLTGMDTDDTDDTEDEEKKKVHVRYNVATNLSATALSNLIDDLYTIDETLGPNDELIIVSKKDPSSTDSLTKLMIKKWVQEGIYVHIISLQRLQFNILNHTLVPEHRVLSDKERDVMLKKFNVTAVATQLPIISRFDPVANVLGIRPGQVCEIKRSSRTTVTSDYYRVCE